MPYGCWRGNIRRVNNLRVGVWLAVVACTPVLFAGCNQCSEGDVRQDGACVHPCNTNGDCPDNLQCLDGFCGTGVVSDAGQVSTGPSSSSAMATSSALGSSFQPPSSSPNSTSLAASSSSTTASSDEPPPSSAVGSSGPGPSSFSTAGNSTSSPASQSSSALLLFSSSAASFAGASASSSSVVSSSRGADGSSSVGGASSAPVDQDNDQVLDNVDNCPTVPNANQHDEDGDGVGDACDNCPSVENPGQEDLGEAQAMLTPDGVGDLCDPRPRNAGDSILFFDAFLGTTLGMAWDPASGTWSVSQDELHQTGEQSGHILRLTLMVPTRVAVETAVRADLASMSWNSAGPVLRLNDSLDGYTCRLLWGSNEQSLNDLNNGITGTDLRVGSTMLTTGTFYRLMFSAADGTLGCNGPINLNPVTLTGPMSTGGVGLRCAGMRGSFKYVVVYALGG